MRVPLAIIEAYRGTQCHRLNLGETVKTYTQWYEVQRWSDVANEWKSHTLHYACRNKEGFAASRLDLQKASQKAQGIYLALSAAGQKVRIVSFSTETHSTVVAETEGTK